MIIFCWIEKQSREDSFLVVDKEMVLKPPEGNERDAFVVVEETESESPTENEFELLGTSTMVSRTCWRNIPTRWKLLTTFKFLLLISKNCVGT